jgi:cell division protein ZapA
VKGAQTFRLQRTTQAKACVDVSSTGQMEMGKERLVEIKVFGQTYTVKTDAEEGYIQEVARYVNEKMDEVLKKTKSVSTLNVAILTALNIADDLLKERERKSALLREVEMKSKDLVEKIEIKIGGKEFDKVTITG